MGAVLVSDSRENFERIPRGAQGPKGEQGDEGERGKQGERGLGLSRPLRLALVFLFVLSLAVGSTAYLAATHYYHAGQASQARQNAQVEAAQRRQAAVFEAKLCTTLAEQAANKPPPGSADSNPSRAWEQREHAILTQLGPDVGCGGK
jgi:hypothetical protein